LENDPCLIDGRDVSSMLAGPGSLENTEQAKKYDDKNYDQYRDKY